MHRYGKYVKPYWRYFTLGPICMLTEVVGEVLLPSMMAGIINIGVPGQDVGYIVRQGLLMIGVALLMMAGGVGGNYCSARASLSKAPILVLDEATSSVDTRTEKHIEEGMDRLMQNRTTFVIAHRLSTVRNADCIYVLEQGKILEYGNHEELLARRGRYYELYTGKKELD